jgi:hypothetical protein
VTDGVPQQKNRRRQDDCRFEAQVAPERPYGGHSDCQIRHADLELKWADLPANVGCGHRRKKYVRYAGPQASNADRQQ